MSAPLTPLDAYVAPAENGYGAWWRVLLGIGVVGLFWVGWSVGLLEAVEAGALAWAGIGADAFHGFAEADAILSPGGVMAFLLTFVGLWIGLWVALRPLHGRRFGTLYRPSGRPLAGNLAKGALLAVGFHAATLAIWTAVLGAPERSDLAFGTWALWVVPIVLGVMVQATSEELVFRGYLLQHFAAWSRNPLIWAVAPALVFTALHYVEGMEAATMGRMLVHILIFGLLAALLVWRTGGLGAAIGLHVANNILAIAVFGMEGTALGFELWLFGPDALVRMFPVDLALAAAMTGAALLLFRPERAA